MIDDDIKKRVASDSPTCPEWARGTIWEYYSPGTPINEWPRGGPDPFMVLAGFKRPEITVPLDPEAAARLIHKHFQGEALEALVRLLTDS